MCGGVCVCLTQIFIVYLDLLLFSDEILHTKREVKGRGRCGGGRDKSLTRRLTKHI